MVGIWLLVKLPWVKWHETKLTLNVGCIHSLLDDTEAPKVKRTLLGMAEAGEPLMSQALEEIRAHNEAEAQGPPAVEIERLRLQADHLHQIVIDYQLGYSLILICKV